MDASNLLKPALARGELHCIGATTLDEYRKHVEKDAALARRFQPVFVAEPTVEDTISILRGLKDKYEQHHGVRITDSRARRGGDAVEPLHHRPLPARQGDRPGRRGGGAAEDAGRFQAGRARFDRPRDRAAEDRAGGAEEGDRHRLQERLQKLEKELADLEEQIGGADRALEVRRRTSSPTRRSSRASSTGCASNSPTRSAAANTSARANSPMGGFRNWRRSSRTIEASEDAGDDDGGGGDRQTTSRRSCRAGPAFPSTRCWKARRRSC